MDPGRDTAQPSPASLQTVECHVMLGGPNRTQKRMLMLWHSDGNSGNHHQARKLELGGQRALRERFPERERETVRSSCIRG